MGKGQQEASGAFSLHPSPSSTQAPGPFMEPAILLSPGEKPASLYRPLHQPVEKQVLEIRRFKTNKLPYRLKRGKDWAVFFSSPLPSLPLPARSLSLLLLSFPLSFPLVLLLSFLVFFLLSLLTTHPPDQNTKRNISNPPILVSSCAEHSEPIKGFIDLKTQ